MGKKRGGKNNNNNNNNNNNGQKKFCQHCKIHGHSTSECWKNNNNSKKNKNQNNSKKHCNNCNLNNHNTFECTKPKNNNNNNENGETPSWPCQHCSSPDQHNYQNYYQSSTPFPQLNPHFNAPCEHCGGGDHYTTQCLNRGPAKSKFIPQTWPFNSDPIQSYSNTNHPLYNGLGQPVYDHLDNEWNEDWNLLQYVPMQKQGHWKQQGGKEQRQQTTSGAFARRDVVFPVWRMEDRDGDVIMDDGYSYEQYLYAPQSYW